MTKKYYFISGLPRSGSTLLSAILKQNPNFYSGISSSLYPLCSSTIETLSMVEDGMILSPKKINNILLGLFDSYYKDESEEIIFDTNRLWTSKLDMLSGIFLDTKIICCVRNICWILDSFERIMSKNYYRSSSIIREKNKDNVFNRCDDMMDHNTGVVGKPFISLIEGYSKYPELIHFVEYENFCKHPEDNMKKIYKFLKIPYFKHTYDNLIYHNNEIDKIISLDNLHTIKSKVLFEKRKTILPKEIWGKYSKEANIIDGFCNKNNINTLNYD